MRDKELLGRAPGPVHIYEISVASRDLTPWNKDFDGHLYGLLGLPQTATPQQELCRRSALSDGAKLVQNATRHRRAARHKPVDFVCTGAGIVIKCLVLLPVDI